MGVQKSGIQNLKPVIKDLMALGYVENVNQRKMQNEIIFKILHYFKVTN